MSQYINLIEKIAPLTTISNSIEELWGYISLKGNYDKNIYSLLRDLDNYTGSINCSDLLNITFDKDNVTVDDIKDYEQNENAFTTWEVKINKALLIKRKLDPNFNVNIFLSSKACEKWLKGINPLENTNPINYLSPLKIIVGDLEMPFGGEFLCFVPADSKYSSLKFVNNTVLPSNDKIKECVHFLTTFEVFLEPKIYILSDGDFSSTLAQHVLNITARVLAICIIDEYWDDQNMVVDGVKKIRLRLYDENESYSYSFHKELIDLIKWEYDERVMTRKKLFNERLTLDLNQNDTLLAALSKNLTAAFEQAKDRYSFIVLERKDVYIKELKDLLKDLRGQSELIAQKIRSLLTNFLRDVLATLVLIGFTIFTKFSDNIGLDKNRLLYFVFFGLGIYFITSILLQSIIDVTDINITNNELKYWKNASKELLSESEFNNHYQNSLRARMISLKILYPIIAFLYLVIAVTCFKYPEILKQLEIYK